MTGKDLFITTALASGLMPVPFKFDENGNKTTACKWKEFADRTVTEATIRHRFQYGTMCGFCLASNEPPYMVVIDLDCHGGRTTDKVEEILHKTRIMCGAYGVRPWVAKTPSGGYHIYLFTIDPQKKKVVASYTNGDDMIDWRAGSCLVVAPTPGITDGYTWDTEPYISNNKYVTTAFPETLIKEIRKYYVSCNQHIIPFVLSTHKPITHITKDRQHLPGVVAGSDRDFVESFLVYHGWQVTKREGSRIRIRHSKKADGGSSAVYDFDQTMFTNFSTSCNTFGTMLQRHKDTTGKEGIAMQFIYLFAHLETNGDMKAAAKLLSDQFKGI